MPDPVTTRPGERDSGRDPSLGDPRDTSPRGRRDPSPEVLRDVSPLQGEDGSVRICRWCRGPIRAGARKDTRTCSKRCRQAAHRFATAIAHQERADQPLALAYADPPYPGHAEDYRDHPDYGGEVDHAALLAVLAEYDGWALSTSAEALPDVLLLCRGLECRVASWHRGVRPGQSRRPHNGWEPVVYHAARQDLRTDWISDALYYPAHGMGRLTDPARCLGAKPAAFASWLFGLLGARVGDSLDDLFPGSGGIGRAFDLFSANPVEPSDATP